MNICISENIRKLRSGMGLTQETLAERTGVTVQAVSKWENGLSCPDIALLPEIADIFGITVDSLLRGDGTVRAADGSGILGTLPDDGVVRVVEAVGNRLLAAFDVKDEITLLIPAECRSVINVEVRGSCNLNGNISGDLSAEGEAKSGDVGGNVNANCGAVCGDVGGDVNAGCGVVCGDVSGNVNAGNGVTCKDVGGSVSAGDKVSCGDVAGCVSCEGDIECGDISGVVLCNGGMKQEA